MSDAPNSNRTAPLSHAAAVLSGGRLIWEHLGLVVGGSFLWTLSLMIAWSLGRALTRSASPGVSLLLDLFLFPLLASPASAALTFALWCAQKGRIAGADRFREGAVKYTRLFAPLLLLETLAASAFLASALFYARLGGVGFGVAAICLYLAGAGLAFSLLTLPVLIAQEEGIFDDPDRKASRGVRAALRRSALLFLAHPFLVFVVALLSAALLLLCIAFVIPFAIFWIGASLSLMTAALQAMLQEQGIAAPLSRTEGQEN